MGLSCSVFDSDVVLGLKAPPGKIVWPWDLWPSPQRSKPWPWHLHRHFLASPSTSRLDNYYNDNRLWCGGI